MSKIICKLENASDLINGIKFGPVEGVEGLVSEEVSESVAALFLSIPGYVLEGAEGEEDDHADTAEQAAPAAPVTPAAPAETPAQRKARLKLEKEAKEAAEKEAEEQAAADKAADDAADAGNGSEQKPDEVF